MKRWRVLLFWLVIIAILGVGAGLFFKAPTNAITIPGTQAQKTLDRYAELFPKDGKGSGRIVLATHDGKKVDDYKSQITHLVEAVASTDGVAAAVNPFSNPSAISADRTIAYIPISLTNGTGSIATATYDGINQAIIAANQQGLEVESGGDLINKLPAEILGVGEISGVVLALVVLLITFASLVAAGMPIAIALLTVAGSMAGLFSLSQLLSINSTTPVLAVMLGLAVGIDYSLFIISRYKSFLLEGYAYKEAAGRALATAGSAVVFAASTVVIALAALTIVQIPFMTSMGLAAAATVALAAIIAITLIPSLLGFAGHRIFVAKTRRRIADAQAQGPHHSEHVLHTTFWYKLGHLITVRPILTLLIAVIAVVTIAIPVTSLKLGLPVDEYAAADSTQRKAYDLVSQGFGPGANGPLLLVVEGMPAVSDADRAAVRAQLATQYGSAAAAPQVKALLDAQVTQYAPYYQLQLIAQRIGKVADVKQALPAQVTDNGTKGVIQVIPDSGPFDQATIDLISYLRDPSHVKDLADSNGVTIGITGSTALVQDINKKMADALPEYLLVVVGLSFILLVIAFRSILVPLKATLGFLLSVAAMLGGLVAVFQWGWFGITDAPGPIISFIPIIGVGILFGLAMDYEFFLVSGMHEAHQHTKDAHKAVMRGFSIGSKVVMAAGFIMVSVFAGFVSNHDTTIQALGFALALGIFIDAFIVRLVIVPAVMTLLKNAAWWLPKWLERILPHISIEGD